MASKLEILFEELYTHTKYSTYVIRAMFQALQQREAEKVAESWRPYYAVVGTATTQQIVRSEGRRGSLAIFNAGGSTVLLSEKYFEGPDMAVAFALQNPGSVLPVIPLAVGANTSIPAKDALYAYNVNGAAGPMATLSIIETIFHTVGPHKQGTHPGFGEMGHAEKGTQIDPDLEETVKASGGQIL